MLAFHNDPAIKVKYLARVEQHRLADDLVRGKYGYASRGGKDVPSGWRGCALGCTFHLSLAPHHAAEVEIGVPKVLALLEDDVFESMSEMRHTTWPGQFLNAIPVGANLADIWPQVAIWLLVDAKHGVLQHTRTDAQRAAVQHVAALYARLLAGENVAVPTWEEAAEAARTTTHEDDVYTAYAAIQTAVYGASYGAYGTASIHDGLEAIFALDAAALAHTNGNDVVARAAYAAYYDVVADKLLTLLKAAPLTV